MQPSFKEKFAEIRTCRSHEQCTGPTQKTQPIHKRKCVCIQNNNNGVHVSKSGVRIVHPIMSNYFRFYVKYINMYIVAICLILWD